MRVSLDVELETPLPKGSGVLLCPGVGFSHVLRAPFSPVHQLSSRAPTLAVAGVTIEAVDGQWMTELSADAGFPPSRE